MKPELRGHPAADAIDRYVRGGPMSTETEWVVEAHLEQCADCRARIDSPEVSAMVSAVWTELTPIIAASTPATARRVRGRLAAWGSPATLSWLAAAVAVVAVATMLGQAVGAPDGGTMLFLLAPVVPVLGVALSWSRSFDPLHELTASSPRAGLPLLLRRTAVVLVLVIPLLALESLLVHTSPVLWALPSLTCTLVALALGGLIGVERATAAVAGLWLLAFGPPVLLLGEPPALLGAWNPAMWTALALLAAVVLVVRRASFTRIDPTFGR